MTVQRRRLLQALGGSAVVGVAGYGALVAAGEEGRVFWRRVAADTSAGPGTLIVLTQRLDRDGTTYTEVDPEFEDEIGAEPTVPRSLHQRLQQRYGRDEPYYLLGYRAHNCNRVPGDEDTDRTEVSRRTFNASRLGDCVKLEQ
ncbi:MAG: hypothetical protein ABEJ05_11880 [Haloglomus sp.]